jgi:hypothetical protein
VSSQVTASWAKFAPAVHESAGTKEAKKRPKDNPWLGASRPTPAGQPYSGDHARERRDGIGDAAL